MRLREYQTRTINQLYHWLEHNDGHPCVVLPTGAGKSHVIAHICKDALQNWPETRIVMLTHQKELIEQNAQKLRQIWPNAPLGIYSASVGRKDLDEPITFAGIQSLIRADPEPYDLILIDECHLVNHKQEGSYRSFIDAMPNARVIGFTATPYRLGHGLITDKPAIFDDLIEPVTIKELVDLGHLSVLRSKITDHKLDVSGVHKRGGEFIESELQAAMDTELDNAKVVQEVIAKAGDRRSWLIFCTGVQHANHIADLLTQHGIVAECVTGETPKAERERLLKLYKSGQIRALTNANVLTTGFDAPAVDLIAFLRPTMSPSLYVQMAGRGCRVADGKQDCLVLDFAGNIARHGPITDINPPSKKGTGDAPVKVCPECDELVHLSAKQCPACGYAFPIEEKQKVYMLDRQSDIMGNTAKEFTVSSWVWRKHVSKSSGKEMLCCTYYGNLADKPIREYFPVLHDGNPGMYARRDVWNIAYKAGTQIDYSVPDIEEIAQQLTNAPSPTQIEVKKDGKWHRIVSRTWPELFNL